MEIKSILQTLDLLNKKEYIGNFRYGASVYSSGENLRSYFQSQENEIISQAQWYHVFLERLMNLLVNAKFECSVAINENNQAYLAGIFNEFNNGVSLHQDTVCMESPKWYPLNQVSDQFAYLIKITEASGGETVLYNKKWSVEDEEKRLHSYDYDKEIIKGIEKLEISANSGDLIIFNSQYYHSVKKVTNGNRITFGGFIGKVDSKGYIIWG